MAKKEKLYEQMKANNKGWSFEILSKLLEWYGFGGRSGKGSHFVFKHPVTRTVVVPAYRRGDLHAKYAKSVVKAIEEVIAHQENSHEQG
ncbi:MAG: type II toxin-antitoxin system HicA family toxin [Anaerolineaceae bacterium]|nr:type II toxin-antitoxin system HicA family toxin [Anaerolineaceae bacterium]